MVGIKDLSWGKSLKWNSWDNDKDGVALFFGMCLVE